METRSSDIDMAFATMDELRRRIDQLFGDIDAGRSSPPPLWPRLRVVDTGSALVVKAEVPGLSDKDVTLTIDQDVLTLRGEREPDAPEEYVAQRQERPPSRFARSVTLPCRIDPEETSASIANGVLTITLTKATEAQPRQISVRAS